MRVHFKCLRQVLISDQTMLSVICFLVVKFTLLLLFVRSFEGFFYSFPFKVCLTRLNDKQNAFLAFERSIMLPDALKNPLIHLNFAVFCYQNGKFELSLQYLKNFLEMAQQMDVNREVCIVFKCIFD